MKISAELLLAAMKRCNYRVFEGELNLNLIGVRHNNTRANTFNDVMCALYQEGGKWQLKQFKATTDPGTYYRKQPINVDGTAIIAAMQHRSLWTFGYHQGKYPALVQNLPVTVHRDNDLDDELDTDVTDKDVTQTGYFGINCHHASASHESKQVDRWSAGCQVFASPVNFDEFIKLCRESAQHWGNTFTYTLLTQQQLSGEKS